MIEAGASDALGAFWDGSGVNFAVFAPQAEAVELCLFDAKDNETARHSIGEQTDGIWHGRLPGCEPGQRYGYRVRGPYDPAAGLRFNPNKLLLDPYAREISGRLIWAPAVFGYHAAHPRDLSRPGELDSAPFVPKAVVTGKLEPPGARPDVPWPETIIYEAHVRGYTMRHPAVPDADRGTFRGLSNGEVLAYLKSLGITSVELMPAQAFVTEQFLEQRGLSNYWGYNTLAFFAPEPRYLGGGGIHEFVEMTNAIHDAGLEVILDVVYNHTAEGGQLGPTLSFKGLDNGAYYRLAADDASEYINDTGCGNTINTDHPIVRRLIRDSLAYWHEELGVDGFRFDLAPVLGRTAEGFTQEHPFFAELANDARLVHAKLIAEPWDVGPGGYQLGAFPTMFGEWNDRYRDTVRQFWRGDDKLPELGAMVAGSAELFEHNGRGPWASINFIASHDGFTTADLVSYVHRHNAANGEQNRDGHSHNYSANYGVEGPTDDPAIVAMRRRQRLNMLMTLLMSQGTPMLLAGDEFGNSQGGNNNAYVQDNETGWLDWSGLTEDPEFVAQVRALIALRRNLPLLRRSTHLHGRATSRTGRRDIDWLDAHGVRLSDGKWQESQTLTVLYCDTRGPARRTNGAILAVALMLNVGDKPVEIELPRINASGGWYNPLNGGVPSPIADGRLELGAVSSLCVLYSDEAPPSLEESQ